MFNWILKNRQKSEKGKRFTAFLISIFFTGIIFVVWLSVWIPNFKKQEELENRNFDTPKDNFVQTISSSFTKIKETFSELKNIVKTTNLSTDLEYKSQTPQNEELVKMIDNN